jgi:hypothetical protein
LARLLPVLLIVVLCACDRQPEFPPPQQFQLGSGPDPELMIDFSQPEAATHIVKDVDTFVHGSWVWTGQEPTLKILAMASENMKLRVDFTLLDDGLKKTGPVTLIFRVNGKDVDKVRYETPGNKRFEKTIPSGWLTAEKEATVSVAIDKLFPTADGTKYGFILSRIGFTR